DIANTTRELSRFLSCYNHTHWDAARRHANHCTRILEGMSTYCLSLNEKKCDVTYEVYIDASFGCLPKERKSVTDYMSL
ncbi:hypothetical protein PHYSODRAFT_405130, partial [Phytophthora sojae]